MAAPSRYRDEDTRFSVDRDDLITRLSAILPGEGLIVHEAGLRAYECDGLSAYRQLPLVVAVPETVEQVQAVLRLASEWDVPVVARGSGTSLSGGALPHPQGILLSLGKFNRILSVDAQRRIARVQPGVRNLAISEAAAPHGLYYAPDPSSQIACSIGGNVSENAGGV
ncbi:FAD-binding protein, partial [Arhodomonas sp. KWT]